MTGPHDHVHAYAATWQLFQIVEMRDISPMPGGGRLVSMSGDSLYETTHAHGGRLVAAVVLVCAWSVAQHVHFGSIDCFSAVSQWWEEMIGCVAFPTEAVMVLRFAGGAIF